MDINTEFKLGHSEVVTLRIVLQNLNLIRIVDEKTRLAYERKEYCAYAFELAPELVNVYLQCNDQNLNDFEEILCGHIVDMENNLGNFQYASVVGGYEEVIREKYQVASFIRLIFVVVFGFESQSQNAFRALMRLGKTYTRMWNFTPLYYSIIGESLVKTLLEYSGRVVFLLEREQVFLRFFSILANIMITSGNDPLLETNIVESSKRILDRSSVDTFFVASVDEDFDLDTKTLIELPEIKGYVESDNTSIIDSDDDSYGYLNCFESPQQEKKKKKTGFSLHTKARQKWKQNFAKLK